MSPMTQDHKLYEVAYLISPAYSEEEAQNFQESLKNHVQNSGGLLDHEGDIVKKRLSYPIKKMAEAHLAHFRFLISPEKIEGLKAKLSAKEVLRHLLTQTKRLPPRPIRARVFKATPQPQPTPQAAKKLEETETQSAVNIEEIDKKLEEILGK